MPQFTRRPPVTLHLGAHRTATGGVQHLLTAGEATLARQGIAVWTPRRTRDGLLAGVVGDPGRMAASRDLRAHRAAGRVAMLRDEMAHQGIDRLIVSDPALLGGLRENRLLGRLYPTAAARLDRLRAALPGIDRVVLSIRSQDAWWTSVFAHLVMRGFVPPDRATIDAVLKARRNWRDVIGDVAGNFPDARLTIWTHEDMAARPDRAFRALTGEAPVATPPGRLNASPTAAAMQARLYAEDWPGLLPEIAGHYAPFTPDERAILRARYHEDLTWLRGGADGLVGHQDAPAGGPYRDRRPAHGKFRRQGQMGTAG